MLEDNWKSPKAHQFLTTGTEGVPSSVFNMYEALKKENEKIKTHSFFYCSDKIAHNLGEKGYFSA